MQETQKFVVLTTAPAPSNSALFVAHNFARTMYAGQTYAVSVTLQNIGNTTWSAGEQYRLAMVGNDVWGRNRVELTQNVPPQGTYTFQTTVVAPITTGSYTMQWQMVREGVAFFGAATPGTAVNVVPVPPVNDAKFSTQLVPSRMYAGTSYPIKITMINTGSATWTAGQQYTLGATAAADWGVSTMALTHDVPPTQSFTFTANVVHRTNASTYPMQWRMLRAGTEWFGEATPALSINTAAPGAPVTAEVVQSGLGGRLSAGTMTLGAGLSGTAQSTNDYPDTVIKIELREGSAVLQTVNYVPRYDDTGPDHAYNDLRSFNLQSNFGVGKHDIYLRFYTYTKRTQNSSTYTVNVLPAPVYGAELVGQSAVPNEMAVGATTTMTVTMKNKSNLAWTMADGFKLGMTNPANNTTWGPNRVELPASVEPEQSITFTIPIKAPATAGTYNLQTQMLREGVQWFGSMTPNVAIAVKNPTQTALAASTTSPVTGDPVTLTATVTGNSPTGSVVFADGATTLATVPLSSGVASYSTRALANGVHSITARYVGSGTHMSSASTAVGVTWAQLVTTTALSASSTSATVGSTVTLTATVSGSPSGSVMFKEGATVLATRSISNGVATFVTPKFSGAHTITAHYPGSVRYRASVSPAVTVTWAKVTTTTSLSSSASVPFTFTATVVGNTPGGTVKFMDGTVSLGSVAVVNGNANLLALGMATGNHSITAVYSGDAGNHGSTSAVKPVTVGSRTASAYDGAIQRTTYVVMTGDVNGDGQNDLLFKAQPGAVSPSSPTFTLISSAYGVYALVVNPAAATLNAAAWQPANQQIVYGGPDGTFAGSIKVTAAFSTQASFVVAMAAATGNLFIASTTAPQIDPTKPASPATPLPVDIVPPELDSENAGTLPGALSVSHLGAATYSIPIVVPPGTAGMQPGLSLNYNSQAPNGILGLGWSLGGLSSIGRCGKTIAQDGVSQRISFSATDRLCLDGQRLVLVNAPLSDANYWSANAEYRTEIESFNRIRTKFVTVNGSSVRSFEVWSKDGRISTYGSTESSYVRAVTGPIASGNAGAQAGPKDGPQSWALDTIKDRSGNFIKISYEQNGTTGEHRATFFRYGGSGLASHAAVQFVYAARPDAWKRYLDETRNDIRSRIEQINTYVGTNLDGDVVSSGKVVRTYALHYDLSPTSGRSLLDSVQVSARNPDTNLMESFRPTRFDWGKPDPYKQAGFESKGIWPGAPILTVNNTTTNFGNQAQNRAEYFAFNDFNGDGLSDVLEKRVASEYIPQLGSEPALVQRREASNPIAPGTKRATYRYFHNSGSGFTQYTYSLSTGENFVVLGVGDFDGNGKLDLFVSTDSGSKICLSPLGSSGAVGAPGANIQFNCRPRVAIDNWGNTVRTRAYVFDPLGDGRSAVYSTIRDQDQAGVATFCSLAGCTLDNNPPGILGLDPTLPRQWHDDMPELTYSNLEQMVDFGGVGKPFDVRWSEAKWVRSSADGVLDPNNNWEWANKNPAITITSLGGPYGASALGGFAAYHYGPVPYPAPYPGAPDGSQAGYQFDSPAGATSFSADFNGSGYNSIAFGFLQIGRRADTSVYLSNAETTICLSTGRGLDCGVRKKFSGDQYRQVYAVGDFVGDGYAAIMARPLESQPFPGRPQPGAAVEMCRVTGDDTTNGTGTDDSNIDCKSWPGMSLPSGAGAGLPYDQTYAMDLLGTGRPQTVVYRSGRYVGGAWVPGAGWEVFAPIDVAVAGQALDRIYQVTNGLGASASVEYVDGVPSGVVRQTGNHPVSYPLRSIRGAGKIVSRLKVGTGGGSVRTTSYLYEDPATDATGRGSQGFAVVQSTDEQSGIVTRTERRQDWPLSGSEKTSTVTDRHGVVLSSTVNTPGIEMLAQANGTATVCPVLKQSVVTRRDLSDPEHANYTGFALGTSTIVNSYTDGWCNANVQSTTTVDGAFTFNTTTTTAFQNDSTNWFIGLPTTSVVSRTDSSAASPSLPRTIKNEYDSKGLLSVQTVEPDDVLYRVVMRYDRTSNAFGLVNGKAVAWFDPATNSAMQRTELTTYDTNGRFPSTVTNALGQSETHTFSAGSGARTSLLGPNGLQTVWTVDGFGRSSVEKRADGNETRSYQKFCTTCPGYAVFATIIESFHGADRIGAPQVIYSDNVGHVVRNMSWGFDGRVIVTDSRYDALGRLAEIDHPRYDTASAVLKVQHVYDDLNRSKHVRTFEIGNSPVTVSVQYQGLVQTATNALGQQRIETRDGLGQVRKVVQVRKLDGIDVVTKFGYDAFGSLVQTIDPNTNVISVVYDKLGRKTDLKDPDLGWIHYDVDPLGQVWRQVSPKQRAAAQSTTFRFDSLGRMTARYEPDLESHWVFDQKPGTNCLAGHSCGQLVEAFTQTGNVKDYIRSHTFDVLGRPRTSVQVIGDGSANSTFQTTTDYDDWSRAIRQTYQRNADAAKVFDSRYNNAGYLARLERGAIVLWQVDEQDASNRPTRVAYGNGLTQSDVFNVNTDRLENATLATGAGLLRLQEGYFYDALGNVKTRTQYWDIGGFTETFEYDELNRLKSSEVGTRKQKFAYDDAGNIKSWIGGDNTGGANYVYPVQGSGAVRPHAVQQIDAGPVYQYDANGNMTVAPGRTYTWNSFDMPITMTKAGAADMMSSTFVYGPEHQRTRQSRSDGSVEVYGGAQVTEKSKTGVLTVKTYWPYGVGLEIDVTGAPPVLHWIHTDRLGSPVAISDQAGVLKERLAYDAWGKRRSTDGTNLTPDSLDGKVDNRGFTSHEMLDQLDLIHMNGRVFDPSIGRFLTPDLLLEDPINGQNYNRYSYVLNNPTNFTDPTGFSCEGTKPDHPGCKSPAPSESDKKDREEKAKKLKDCKALTTCLRDGKLVWVKDGDGNAAAYKVDDAKASNGKFIAKDGSSFTVASANTGATTPAPGTEGSEYTLTGGKRLGFWESAWIGTVSASRQPITTERVLEGIEALPVGKLGAGPMNLLGKIGQWINGCCCFPAGTPVATEFGMIRIEEIRVGQLVYARDPATGETKLKPVTQLMITKAKPLYVLVTEGVRGNLESMEVTDNHPYWVKDRGWIDAVQLEKGMVLQSLGDGELTVSSLKKADRDEVTYNFTVADFHTYFAGNQKAFVHNCACAVAAEALAKSAPQAGWIAKNLYSKLTSMVDGGKMSVDTLNKFENALKAFTSGQGGQGIKPLTGGGLKIGGTAYQYELKILGKDGGYRLYGNAAENGQIVFDQLRKSH